MVLSLVVSSLLMSAGESSEAAMTYKACVEEFASDQIRSGESAETLVRAGESNCSEQRAVLRAVMRVEIEREVRDDPNAQSLIWSDVQKIIDEGLESRMELILSIIREAALRNVVFFKSRVKEIEGGG